jgi:hydrogenase maturation protein HypF
LAVIQRVHIALRGAVQGVGFRPFVYRLASDLHLPGWVLNSPQGVFIEVEGEKSVLDSFLIRLSEEKPQRSFIQSLEFSFLDAVGLRSFEIRRSDAGGPRTALVLPDIAACPECVAEISDPRNRRSRYPFTNCINCGPRFSIILALPYDRANTSMKAFEMCAECRREYENPANRRFHAQPNACPRCGPHLELWDPEGRLLSSHDQALCEAAGNIRAGRIVAVKGLGGFHLMVDARNPQAVLRLRERKHREEKPLALMYPSLASIREECRVSPLEERLLLSAESPIVLLKRKGSPGGSGAIAESVAPRNPYLGIMLPYTPLHHLLMRELGFPAVATSGNISDEPISTGEHEALHRLRGIADLFLVHNRPIVRHADDSIVRVLLGRQLLLRRARGYAPLPFRLQNIESGILAVGGHLKNAIALTVGDNVFVSQHIGDLENSQSAEAFREVIDSFRTLYEVEPIRIAADLHPDYFSTRFARSCPQPVTAVQHHYAHVASCMAENQLEGRILGVSWDGTGYGLDGTIWGGEFLLADQTSFQRMATFREFRLPGGERAIKEPRRTALGILYEIMGSRIFQRLDLAPLRTFGESELTVLEQMLRKAIHSPLTTSAGRLFDAVSSMLNLCQHATYEGQAAMELEFAIAGESSDEVYPFALSEKSVPRGAVSPGAGSAAETRRLIIVDWEPLFCALLEDVERHVAAGEISRRFHNTLAEIIVAVAGRISEQRIVLTGGCFQNGYLTERAVRRLEAQGFSPYWHQRLPPNDGGIAFGQAVAAAHQLRTIGREQDSATAGTEVI